MKSKITLNIKGMDCSACVINIDGALEDTDGVNESRTNYAKSQTTVDFNPEKVALSKLLSIIKKTGYDAEVLTK